VEDMEEKKFNRVKQSRSYWALQEAIEDLCADAYAIGQEEGEKLQKAKDLLIVEKCLTYIPMKDYKKRTHAKGYEHGINIAIKAIGKG
jgi:hypothetical protein